MEPQTINIIQLGLEGLDQNIMSSNPIICEFCCWWPFCKHDISEKEQE